MSHNDASLPRWCRNAMTGAEFPCHTSLALPDSTFVDDFRDRARSARRLFLFLL